jgi:hypothetical protein
MGNYTFTIIVIGADRDSELHKSKLGLWVTTSVSTPEMDTGKELRRKSRHFHSRTLLILYSTWGYKGLNHFIGQESITLCI